MNCDVGQRPLALSEAQVRALRDEIYGRGTDRNWDACKENWMQPAEIAWLQARVAEKQRPKIEK